MEARPTVRVATEDRALVADPQAPKPATAQTDRILAILQHALGRNEYGHNPNGGPDYRNHFVAGEGTNDARLCRDAVAQGLMREHPASALSGGDPVFTVTDAGKAYVAEKSPLPPRLTLGQKRYRRWLHVADATGETFGEWLKREHGGAR